MQVNQNVFLGWQNCALGTVPHLIAGLTSPQTCDWSGLPVLLGSLAWPSLPGAACEGRCCPVLAISGLTSTLSFLLH